MACLKLSDRCEKISQFLKLIYARFTSSEIGGGEGGLGAALVNRSAHSGFVDPLPPARLHLIFFFPFPRRARDPWDERGLGKKKKRNKKTSSQVISALKLTGGFLVKTFASERSTKVKMASQVSPHQWNGFVRNTIDHSSRNAGGDRADLFRRRGRQGWRRACPANGISFQRRSLRGSFMRPLVRLIGRAGRAATVAAADSPVDSPAEG